MSRLLLAMVALALAGCAGLGAPPVGGLETQIEPQPEGAIISEVSAPRDRARVHTELAAAYYDLGNMGVALEEARTAILADNTYAPAYNVLGLVHMDLRDNVQAEANFTRALAVAPNDADANHNYGWFLCQTGKADQSIKYFMTAVRNPLYAGHYKSYTLAGVCALRSKNDRDAVDFLERALRLEPNYLPAIMNLAQLRYRQGELDAARRLVAQYNRLVEPTSESLWLAARVEHKAGDRAAEANYNNELKRRFSGSREFQSLSKGEYE
jgi:type IV pilus assembly protein PilF